MGAHIHKSPIGFAPQGFVIPMFHQETTPMRSKTAILVLLLVGLLIYFNALFNGFIMGDDEDQILNHPYVHSVRNIPRIFAGSTYFQEVGNQAYGLYYRPLMLTAYAILYSIFGPDPLMFHLFSIMLHLVNTLLIFYFLRRFFNSYLSFGAALLFLVHPVNSETVLHSANLQDLLFFSCGMGALIVISQIKHLTFPRALVLGGLLLLSLLAKETALGFLVLIMIWSVLFNRKLVKVLFILESAVVALYVFLRWYVAHLSFGVDTSSIAKITYAPFAIRLLNVPSILFEYTRLLIWPRTLISSYYEIIENATISNFFLPLVILILLVALGFFGNRLVRQDRQSRALFIFFALWILISFGMHLHILIPLEQTLAERWLYMPLMGIIAMGLVVLRYVRVPKNTAILFFIVLFAFSIRTVVRTFDWRDSESLLKTDLQTAPNNYLLQNNRGTLFIRDKKYADAAPFIESSVAQYPYFGNLNNLALVRADEGNFDEAQIYFEKALAVRGGYQVYQNYVNILVYRAQRYEKAREVSRIALTRYPESAYLWIALAQAEYHLDHYDEATQAAQKAFSLDQSPLITEVKNAIQEKKEIEVEKYIE